MDNRIYSIPLMTKISEMYYYEKLSQNEIAKKLKISTSTVSRILTKALNEGIIKVEIIDIQEKHKLLEQKLKKRYQLLDVVVLNTIENIKPVELKKSLGKSAGEKIFDLLKPGQLLGIGPGETMLEMINSINPQKIIGGIRVIPLMGAWSRGPVENEVNKLVHLISSKLFCDYFILPAPAYVSSEEIKNILLDEPYIKEITSLWESVDIAIFSTGIDTYFGVPVQLVNEKDVIKKARKENGVGDILGNIIDEKGQEIKIELNKRLISIPLKVLKNIPLKICVSGGPAKFRSIRGALNSQLINVLITDKQTADLLLTE